MIRITASLGLLLSLECIINGIYVREQSKISWGGNQKRIHVRHISLFWVFIHVGVRICRIHIPFRGFTSGCFPSFFVPIRIPILIFSNHRPASVRPLPKSLWSYETPSVLNFSLCINISYRVFIKYGVFSFISHFPSLSVCVHNGRSNTSAVAELAEFTKV